MRLRKYTLTWSNDAFFLLDIREDKYCTCHSSLIRRRFDEDYDSKSPWLLRLIGTVKYCFKIGILKKIMQVLFIMRLTTNGVWTVLRGKFVSLRY